ncbi:nuclear envelope protein (nucleoporin protein Ndc1-Nup) [Phlyctema vagabunda]|uniref:Nuclear envelope protein (Nucleoporin protein Ndc1-Nup) n=1 Tax=Phlyctema vagabunda TaxID=108571 RepID=A0ABR4PX42_9HELO
MAPALRTRPYKDFLTPALHRRFVRAMAVLGFLCYSEALLIGQWNSIFWSWFPFGRAGIRAGLLFISAFAIFVLRVAQLHVGIRTTTSPFQTFREYAFQFQTVQTAVWYLFSAWMFCEVYIFSAAESSNIRWITAGPNFDRPRLNERPIYLMSYFLILALLQTGIHLFYDYDRIDMPVTKTKPEASSDQRAHLIQPAGVQIREKFPHIVQNSLTRSAAMTIVTPFIYSIFIRRTVWKYALGFAKIFWNLPKSTALPAISPFHFTILFKTFVAGALLIGLWESANLAFSAYVAQEPLKNERPITHESRDPNGSLLTGLNGKKLQTKAFAFWELVYISQRFQGRRKIIFEDIDRKGGSAWTQIFSACLEIINGVNQRITQYENPTSNSVKPEDTVPEATLPRLAQPLTTGNVFSSAPAPVTRRAGVAQTVGSIARSHGQSTSPGYLKQAKAVLLNPKHQEAVVPGGFQAMIYSYAVPFLNSFVGWPFRQAYQRRINSIVLGTPYGDVGIIVDAIDALTRFAVCSLTEDKYGNVQRDVKTIISTFTATINQIQKFRTTLTFHWTDVEKKAESPEVDIILATLKGGLHELLAAFEEYAFDLRLSQAELRSAREAAAPVPSRENQEMAERR